MAFTFGTRQVPANWLAPTPRKYGIEGNSASRDWPPFLYTQGPYNLPPTFRPTGGEGGLALEEVGKMH